jgi:pilus assembly protein FimV
MSFMDQLNAMLPVPLWTVLAGLGAVLFGLGGLRWARARRARRSEEAAAAALAGAPALAEDESMLDQYARTELPADREAEVTELPAIGAAHDSTVFDEDEVAVAANKTQIDHVESGHLYAGPGVDDDDPLAEVNVYLAYERFDQAEQLVRDAISRYPQHHEYKLKLLEVFYAAKNVAGFEMAAHDLRAAVGDEHELMQQARAWWQDLGTGRELFAEDDASAMQSTQTGLLGDDDLFDVTAPDSADETGVDFDLGFDSDEGAAGASSLDFDLGADDQPAGESADAGLDFDLGGFDTDEGRAPAGTAVDFDLGADADAPAGDSGDTGLDFDLDGLDAEPARPGTETAELPERGPAAGDTGLDFDVFDVAPDSDKPRAAGQDDDLDFTLDDGGAGTHAAAPATDEDGVDSGLDFDLSDTTTFGGAGVASESGRARPDAGADEDRAADRSGATTVIGGLPDDNESGSGLDFDLGDDAAASPHDEPKRAHAAGTDLDLDLSSGDADDSALSLDMDLGDDATSGAFQDARTQVSDGSELDLTLEADDPTVGARRDDEVDFPLLDMGDDDRPVGGIDTVRLSPQDSDASRSQAGVPGSDDDDERGFGVDTEFRDIFAEGGSDADSESGTASVLDFDLGTDLGDDQADGDDDESTQFMLRDLPGDEDDDDHTLVLGRGGSGEVDEMQTKLDLAQAYMDMGDSEGARNLLGEVMAEGGDAQKDLAREMLARLS